VKHEVDKECYVCYEAVVGEWPPLPEPRQGNNQASPCIIGPPPARRRFGNAEEAPLCGTLHLIHVA
jgi:hypothetical protein